MILPTVLLFLSTVFAQDLYEGDLCSMTNGTPGVCTLLNRCSSVYQYLMRGNSLDKLCGYSSFEPVVCCPSNTPTTATTAAPTTTTTAAPTTTTTAIPIEENRAGFGNGRGAKARAKCAEYAKSVFQMVTPVILSVDREPVNVSQCAIVSQKLIVGGKKADPKEFPHMAAIGYTTNSNTIVWRCGGTLISENFVLTAAHCVRASELGNAKWVRVGDLNLERTDDGATPVDRRVTRRIQHPQYERSTQYNDIGLLRLKSRVPFNAWIRPACLHTRPSMGAVNLTATGWGRVEWDEEDGSDDLLKVTIPLVSQETCSRSYPANSGRKTLPNGVFEDRMLCAGAPGRDTCQGDSGGPLVNQSVEQYCMYNVVGVTSLGQICGSTIPGVYSRVYFYVDWIESIVWK